MADLHGMSMNYGSSAYGNQRATGSFNPQTLTGVVSSMPPAPISAVPARLGEQGQEIVELQKAIAELEKQLWSVLTVLPPSTEGCGNLPCGVSVSDRIADHTRALAQMRAVVVSMLERLEL